MKTWNRERKKTRDRLLDYELPPIPYSSCPLPVYPWTNLASQMQSYLLEDAGKYGFDGSIDDLWNLLLKNNIYVGTLNTFPLIGEKDILYLDTETDILYYFKSTNLPIDPDLIAKVGAAIVGTHVVGEDDMFIDLYIPVRALPLENLIFNCGNAEEEDENDE